MLFIDLLSKNVLSLFVSASLSSLTLSSLSLTLSIPDSLSLDLFFSFYDKLINHINRFFAYNTILDSAKNHLCVESMFGFH